MALINEWVGYTDRSYEQIKSQLVTKIADGATGIPEITDHTEGNDFIKMMSIWAGLIEMIGFYLDNRAREVYLVVARRFESAVLLAKQFDYRIKGWIPAGGKVKFTTNILAPSDILIPAGTEVKESVGNISFFTVDPVTILTGTDEIEADVIQRVQKPWFSIGTSNGGVDQVFVLEEKVADGTVEIRVNTVDIFSSRDTLALSLPTDKHMVAGLNIDREFEVTFGDDINGEIPANGGGIEAQYYLTEGSAGNVGGGRITTIVSAVTVPGGVSLSVNNEDAMTGGADAEDLNKLRRTIPKSIRTRYRAVTFQDYIDVTELAPGVAKAGVIYDCGKIVEVYIAPDGGGPASGPLIASTQAYLDLRKMITTDVRVQSAGEVDVIFNIQLNLDSNTAVTTAVVNAQNAIIDLLSIDNQEINGGLVIGDVYEVLEDVQGVVNSIINIMSPRPFARPIGATVIALDWNRTITADSVALTWRIVMTSPTQFRLIRGTFLVGNFTVGTQVVQDEITFTVNADAYVAGDQWEFNTFDPGNVIDLEEPSVLTTDASLITVSTTGGF